MQKAGVAESQHNVLQLASVIVASVLGMCVSKPNTRGDGREDSA